MFAVPAPLRAVARIFVGVAVEHLEKLLQGCERPVIEGKRCCTEWNVATTSPSFYTSIDTKSGDSEPVAIAVL